MCACLAFTALAPSRSIVRPLSVRFDPDDLTTLNLARNLLMAMDPTMFPGVLRLKYPGLTRHPKLPVELLRTWWQLSLAFLKSP